MSKPKKKTKASAGESTRVGLGLPEAGHEHPEHDCGGELVDEIDVHVNGRPFKVAVEGRHHDKTKPSAPWDYYELCEIVQRKGGGTEMLEADPETFDALPAREVVERVVEGWENTRRDEMLSEIAAGLADLDRKNPDKGRGDGTTPLWRVELALLNDDDEVLAVAPIAEALRWVVDRMNQTSDTTDISGATQAHVQVRESGECRSCSDGEHRDPDEVARDRAEAERQDDKDDDE